MTYVSDFFYRYKGLISSFLRTISDFLYDNYVYPDALSKGVIVPIKKGIKTGFLIIEEFLL